MTAGSLLAALVATTASGSLAILFVLALRRPLRRAFNSGAAFTLWSVVPLAIVAVLLPAASLPAIAHALIVPATSAIEQVGVQLRDGPLPQLAPWLFGIWALGVVATALMLFLRQFQFERALGRLVQLGDGTHLAEARVGLPAVIGILRPRIVLPADHLARYDTTQQMLVREHELAHIARGDPVFNLIAAMLRCLFWFNPLVHWATVRFRHDQELACDARVIARYPGERRAYGEALLAAQIAEAAPLSCQIGFGHPLKERIAMLVRPAATLRRRILGMVTVVAVVACAACAANFAGGNSETAGTPASFRELPPMDDLYPAEAKAQGMSGVVYLRVHVTAKGTVGKVQVERSDPPGVFDASAIQYARKMKFKPPTRNGKPVAADLVVPIKFALDAAESEPGA